MNKRLQSITPPRLASKCHLHGHKVESRSYLSLYGWRYVYLTQAKITLAPTLNNPAPMADNKSDLAIPVKYTK